MGIFSIDFQSQTFVQSVRRNCRERKKNLYRQTFEDILKMGSDYRAVARSENPGGHVILGGDNEPPLVEIGLTDLPKSGGNVPPGPPACDGPVMY